MQVPIECHNAAGLTFRGVNVTHCSISATDDHLSEHPTTSPSRPPPIALAKPERVPE